MGHPAPTRHRLGGPVQDRHPTVEVDLERGDPMTGVVEIQKLNKSFGPLHIIRDLSLTIAKGERHAIIGPNGAGKSTLFNLVSGLFAPSSGDIRLNGRSIAGRKPHELSRLGLARSFQITNIFPKLSIFENARMGVMARHGYRFSLFRRASSLRAVNEETDELLELVRLSPVRDRLAGDLAYSDQRALEIAMALSTGASVVMLDEPTAGMSTEETAYIIELIRSVTADKTLLVVEHDMSVVFSLCDRISVLVYGQILATGAPDEIRSNAKVQAAYLGDAVVQETH
jgi:branched-chain amino acid transport system ATP-binding protein